MVPTSLLSGLGAVPRSGLLPVPDPGGVEGPADDLVPHTREVLHPAAADEDDRVFLQVVTDSWDVGGDLDPARQTNARDLAKGRVRLLWGGRVDARTHAAALRRAPERWALRLRPRALAPVSDQLLYGWHGSLGCNSRLCPLEEYERPDRTVRPRERNMRAPLRSHQRRPDCCGTERTATKHPTDCESRLSTH